MKFPLLLACLFVSASIAAEEIVIQDTSGIVRAQGEASEHGDGTVTMNISDSATGGAVPDGTIVTLTPVAGGAALTGTTVGSQIIFTGVAAGSYTVATTGAVTFTSVVVSSGVVVAAAGGAIAGGSAVAVAAGAAGVAGVGVAAASALDGNSNPSPLSPAR